MFRKLLPLAGVMLFTACLSATGLETQDQYIDDDFVYVDPSSLPERDAGVPAPEGAGELEGGI